MRDAGSPCKRSGTGVAVSPDLIFFCHQADKSEHREADVQASDLTFVFTHPHLSVFVSLSPFSMSLRHR